MTRTVRILLAATPAAVMLGSHPTLMDSDVMVHNSNFNQVHFLSAATVSNSMFETNKASCSGK